MVKFLSGKEIELIFNYLDLPSKALLSAVTGYYNGDFAGEGIFAVQFNENGDCVSYLANGESFSLLFGTEKTDLEELLFTLEPEVRSPQKLPFEFLDNYCLLKKSVTPKKNITPPFSTKNEDYETVLSLNNRKSNDGLVYHHKKGDLIPYVVSKDSKNIAGGFITNSQDYSVISHVFVKDGYRKLGLGKEIVNNLLKVSTNERVYLISCNKNVPFYEKLGFKFCEYEYFQMPLRKNMKPMPLNIMSYPNLISENDFKKFRDIIYEKGYEVSKNDYLNMKNRI